MLKSLWSLIAESCVIDQRTNNMSISNVIEQLQVGVPPEAIDLIRKGQTVGAPLKLTFVSVWLNEDQESVKFDIRVTIIDPDNKEIGNFVQEMSVPKGSKRFRSIQNIDAFPLTVAGRYWVKLAFRIQGESRFATYNSLPLDIEYPFEV